MTWFMGLDPIVQALIAGLVTWAFTALGAGLVFIFKGFRPAVYALILGFAAGIMIAASFWGLLEPAVEFATSYSALPNWLVISIGLILGALLVFGADKLIGLLHSKHKKEFIEIDTHRRSILFIISMLLHNLPEGIALGVAFGAIAHGDPAIATAATISALGLMLAIGFHNLPEGAIISFALNNENVGAKKSFFWGQASAVVEPIGAVLGALLVASVNAIMPYAMAFAAGAMFYVVVAEIIPAAFQTKRKVGSIVVLGFFLGFILMLILDLGLAELIGTRIIQVSFI